MKACSLDFTFLFKDKRGEIYFHRKVCLELRRIAIVLFLLLKLMEKERK